MPGRPPPLYGYARRARRRLPGFAYLQPHEVLVSQALCAISGGLVGLVLGVWPFGWWIWG